MHTLHILAWNLCTEKKSCRLIGDYRIPSPWRRVNLKLHKISVDYDCGRFLFCFFLPLFLAEWSKRMLVSKERRLKKIKGKKVSELSNILSLEHVSLPFSGQCLHARKSHYGPAIGGIYSTQVNVSYQSHCAKYEGLS